MTTTTEYDEAMAEAIALGLMTTSGQATDRCACPSCGAVFSTVGNFDRHLTPGRNAEGYDGPWCRPPADVGLVQHARGWWHQPGPEQGDGAAAWRVGATQGAVVSQDTGEAA